MRIADDETSKFYPLLKVDNGPMAVLLQKYFDGHLQNKFINKIHLVYLTKEIKLYSKQTKLCLFTDYNKSFSIYEILILNMIDDV